jgi:D-proline reductase (dithiol) PrdB
MASLSDLPLKYRAFFFTYRFRKLDPIPFAEPKKALGRARVALVSTGAFHTVEQLPFDEEFKGGDYSFREIPGDANVPELRMSHRSDAFDHRGVDADRNLGFPLDRLREMKERGEIGSLASRHLSFMGSITAPGRLVAETAPAAAELLVRDGVDVAILVPL